LANIVSGNTFLRLLWYLRHLRHEVEDGLSSIIPTHRVAILRGAYHGKLKGAACSLRGAGLDGRQPAR
jgi:hypothetical protein